ncbi:MULTISPECIES: hypothetical protein [Nitrosomonas]|uniref:hypothetical protein n=1 Tax=Nitrosomonas TaxID=914 RepID=UPI001F4736F5|nr:MULTISPECIES: hypothetical protein [Nitrosomonas]HNR09758.1 hypothetical protein [Nitrosomonas europaea]
MIAPRNPEIAAFTPESRPHKTAASIANASCQNIMIFNGLLLIGNIHSNGHSKKKCRNKKCGDSTLITLPSQSMQKGNIIFDSWLLSRVSGIPGLPVLLYAQMHFGSITHIDITPLQKVSNFLKFIRRSSKITQPDIQASSKKKTVLCDRHHDMHIC